MAHKKGFFKDENGVGWHHFGDGRRIRTQEFACEVCGKKITSYRSKRFCSNNCKNKALFDPSARAKICPTCKREFIGKSEQVFCSHTCAAKKFHATVEQTTGIFDTAGGLVNSDNPRYSQDERGQWWYEPGGAKAHARCRAHIGMCEQCGARFLKSAYNLAQKHCSRTCGVRAAVADGRKQPRGAEASNWNGGRRVVRGYVVVWAPDHPTRRGKAKPYVFEHRLVMEKILGRVMRPEENVHHRDGNRSNNDPANLELWSRSQPSGQRVEDKVKWARELLALYGELYPA